MEINKISVIMSVYNETDKELSEAINSILNQTYKNIEFIVIIDNPKNNQILECLKKYDDSRLIVIINEKNIGLTASLNNALKIASGDYIARMDADDISIIDRLEKQIKLCEMKNLDIVTSNIILINEKGEKIKSLNNINVNPNILLLRNIYFHPTWLVRRKVYESLNGYRDIKYVEDYDFLCRAIISGFKIGIHPEELLMYRIRKNGISKSNEFNQYCNAIKIRKALEKSDKDLFKYNDYLENDLSEIEKNYIYRYIKTREEKNNLYRLLKALPIYVGDKTVRREINNKLRLKFNLY